MKRTFAWRARTACIESGEILDVLVVFFSRARIDQSVIDDAVQDALKMREPLPDAVVLLSYSSKAEEIVSAWTADQARADALMRRGRSEKFTYIKEFSVWRLSDGKFSKLFRDESSRCSYQFDLKELVLKGLADLVDSTHAYQEAPAGHVFRHPSGRQTKYFLLASELIKDETDAYFVALAVCASAWVRIKASRSAYIDTMGIYPIARAIEDIARSTSSGQIPTWEIRSFHSHAGLDGLHRLIHDDELVIVSASTTGSMARRLADEDGVPEEALITLLDMSDKDRRGHIVYARTRHHRSKQPAPSEKADESIIELAGEYFGARGKKAKTLTLALRHAPLALKTVLETFSRAGISGLNLQRSTNPGLIDLICLSEAEVGASELFRKWVATEIRLKTPLSVTHVIPVAGEGARELGEFCAQEIQRVGGRLPVILSSDDISTLSADSCTGVLICAPVTGNGHALRVLARDLREAVPHASRHFVVGLVLPTSMQAWTRLSEFLAQSGSSSRPYQLSAWNVLPTGADSGMGLAWQAAATLMQRAEVAEAAERAPWPTDVAQDSLQLVSRAIEATQGGFLPSPSGEQLKLTEGFVYWQAKAEQLAACDHAAVCYLAMASAMQNAREHHDLANRLASSLHETVVLDAENFLRFNDGVLQASILRAAQAYELDYSGSPDLSEMMREFVEKVFLNAGSSYGQAALEFALALATGRLRLAANDQALLIERLSPRLATSSVLVGLLYLWWTNSQII